MISHAVIKNSGNAIAVANYLNEEIEGTARYYEEKPSSKIYEHRPPEIDKDIKALGLETDAEKIAFFSGRQRVGYDFTLSFAKDISLLAMLYDESILNDAREVAIKTTQRMAEDVYTRRVDSVTGERKHIKAQALIQTYEHHTSRSHDPELHYHIFISNQVYADGKYTALSAERLVSYKFYHNVLANYELAERMQRKGYNAWLDSHGNVRIIDDDRLVEHFSERTRQIKEKCRELYGHDNLNALSREQYKALVLATRPTKSEKDFGGLKDLWEEELRELGYDRETFLARAKTDFQRELTREEWHSALLNALRKLDGKEGIFRYESLTQEYLVQLSHLSRERNAKLPKLEKAMDYLNEYIKQNLRSYQAELQNTTIPERYFSTHEYHLTEKRAFLDAISLSQKEKPIASLEEIQRAIRSYEREKGFSLSHGQRDAVLKVLSGRQLTLINGHAGAGKTTSAEIVGKVAREKGYRVIALAPTGKASEELSKPLQTDARTIDSFLNAYEKGKVKVDSRTILFVDEAGMVDTRKMERLIQIAKEHDAKLVLQGDHKQLKAVKAGDLYTDLYHHMKEKRPESLAELTDIRRQKREDYRELARAYSEKDFQRAFDLITQKKDQWLRDWDMNALKKDFLENPRGTLIVASTNDLKDQLNREIRKELYGDRGQEVEVRKRYEIQRLEDLRQGDFISLSKDISGRISRVDKERSKVILENGKEVDFTQIQNRQAERVEKIKLEKGDRIITLKNDRTFGVKNGELWEVVEVKDNRLRLRNDRKEVEIDLRKYNYLDYAYAITTHKSQGMTVDRVLIADRDLNLNYNLAYVAITRGRQELRLYTPDPVMSLWRSQIPQLKPTAQRLQRKRQEQSIQSRQEIARRLITDRESYQRFSKYLDDLSLKKSLRERYLEKVEKKPELKPQPHPEKIRQEKEKEREQEREREREREKERETEKEKAKERNRHMRMR